MTMMTAPRPWEAGHPHLHVGLRPVAEADWLAPSPEAEAVLAGKAETVARHGGDAVAALPEAAQAEAELLALLTAHLKTRQPAHWQRFGGGDAAADPSPIHAAGRLVEDDLCLMLPNGGTYVLGAAHLTAPSFWRLAEKLGRPLDAIHGPVPGYTEALSARVDRVFTHLPDGAIVARFNWSMPRTGERFTPGPERRPWDGRLTSIHLRTEHQTLRRLPASRAILFTIRTVIEPLAPILAEPQAAAALARAVRAMPPALKAYKGIDVFEAALFAALDAAA